MRVRWLGWAGVEVEAHGEAAVIDPLADPGALFAPLGERASGARLPEVVPAHAGGTALAGMVTHLHRDHADAGGLAAALAPGAPVYEPAWPGGADEENLGLAQANAELARAGLRRVEADVWQGFEAGPFKLTALPAVDGFGDPQVAWLVEADGVRVLHLGDTVMHGYWWRMVRRHAPFDVVFTPINGASANFPHLQPANPLSAVLTPEQAAIALEILGARTAVPMHYDGFDVEPYYSSFGDALERFAAASAEHDYEVSALSPGESLEVEPSTTAAAA